MERVGLNRRRFVLLAGAMLAAPPMASGLEQESKMTAADA